MSVLMWTFNHREMFECPYLKITVSGQSKQTNKRTQFTHVHNARSGSPQSSKTPSEPQCVCMCCKEVSLSQELMNPVVMVNNLVSEKVCLLEVI